MITLKLILFFLSIFIPGWLVEKIFIKSQESFLFKLALSWGMGAVLLTLELFCLFFLLKLKMNLIIFYLFLTAECALFLYLIIKNQAWLNLKNNLDNWKIKLSLIKFNFTKIRITWVVVFILILIQVVLLSFNALARPPIAYDNLTMWQYKPKVLFYENKINFDAKNLSFLGGGGHTNYPWQTPLLFYWFYANLGEFNDLAGNLINIIYYLSILIVIYYFLKKYLSNLVSLIFVWFFSTMPLPFYHAYNGYADLTLSYYLLIAFIFLFYWLKTQEKKWLLIAGVFFGCALFVKNDALIFILASLPVIFINLFITNKKIITTLKYCCFYLLAIILPLLPWLLIKIKYNLPFSNVEPGFGYHADVWSNIGWALFLNNSFNIWWFVVILSLIINIKKIKKQNNLFLSWLFLILCLTGLIMLYLFTEEYRFAVDNTALSRNFLTLAPISVALAAVSYGQIKSQS